MPENDLTEDELKRAREIISKVAAKARIQTAPHQDRFGRATYVGPAHYLALALCAALFAALMVALKP